jgi:hypothetical protein
MPVSNEFLLALSLAELKSVAERLGLNWREPEQDTSYKAEYNWADEIFAPIAEALAPDFKRVHQQLLEGRLGPTTLHPDKARLGDYLVCDTPSGVREFATMGLGLYGDSGELGEVWPDDFVWGVSLASRYFPIWLDWPDAHGTSGNLRLTAEVLEMIAEAREALKQVVPELEHADFMVKVTFY